MSTTKTPQRRTSVLHLTPTKTVRRRLEILASRADMTLTAYVSALVAAEAKRVQRKDPMIFIEVDHV